MPDPSADRPLLLPEIPKIVTEAAARIRVDIRAAIEVIYGDVGGEDDTAEDVEATERAIARDMATVLDWIAAAAALPPSAEHREEHGMQDRTGKVYPMRDAGDAAFTIPIYVNVGGRHVTRTVWAGPWVEVDGSQPDA